MTTLKSHCLEPNALLQAHLAKCDADEGVSCSFFWCQCDINNNDVVKEVSNVMPAIALYGIQYDILRNVNNVFDMPVQIYDLLMMNYVEDDDAMFR